MCKAKDKNNKSWWAENDISISLYEQGPIIISLWLVSGKIYCKLKVDKQSLQDGESWWQNFSRPRSKKQNENKTEIWIN